QTAKAQ
ncbi:hypothetical protein D046_3002B, partial [Vibrio parahaemolyticus V-223/04]